MTPRRRHSDSGGSHTTRPDTPDAPDAPTRKLGGNGGGTTVNLDNLDTMTTRLNATGGRVDAVGTTVGNINVGPQSMGIIGGNFTGAAQSHLREAQTHVVTTRKAVDNAQAGTTATATGYRDTDQTAKVNLDKIDPNTTVPRVGQNATTTPAAARPDTATTRPDTPPPTRSDPPTQPAPPSSPPSPPAPPASIADRLNPPPDPSPAPGRWEPSTREQELQNRRITGLSNLGDGGNVNEAFKADLDDGSSAVYKPVSGEQTTGMRQDITSDLGLREVAASRVDEMLGFDRVPTTAMVDGPQGPGSLQRFAENSSEGLDADQYPRTQQQQMAVLDYVTGNTDRHGGNYLTGPDGSVVAIDHGFSFPDGAGDPIRSDFVRDHLNQPLDPAVADAVRAVDPGQMRQMLQDSGLSPQATDLAVARLEEIQRRGMITGEAWPGEFIDAWWNPVPRGPMP
jgi:hypothetical protein